MAGRPPAVSDEEILKAIVQIHGPATAGEISDIVGINPSGVNKRLDNLADDNLIHEKKVGANAKVYWLTDKGAQSISPD